MNMESNGNGNAVQQVVLELALEEIAPGNNLRRFFDAVKLGELAESIRTTGVEQPIIVQERRRFELREPDMVDKSWRLVDAAGAVVSEWPQKQEKLAREELRLKNAGARYEIIAGERRWRASALAERKTIPAIVRKPESALAVFNSCLLENLQRQDLTEVEEGQAFRDSIEKGLHTIESLQKLTGLKRTSIYARMKLATAPEEVKQALLSGKLPSSIANYIVKIPTEKLQVRALKEVLNGGGYENVPNAEMQKKCMSAREAARHIERNYTLDLKEATFDPKDGALVTTAGACMACPKRTGTDPEMFPDIKNPNVCTDPDCFKHKSDVVREMTLEKCRHKGMTVLTAKESKPLFSSTYLNMGAGYVDPETALACPRDPKARLWSEMLRLCKKDAPTPVVAVDGTGAVRKLYKESEVYASLEKNRVKLEPASRQGDLGLDSETTDKRVARLLKEHVENETLQQTGLAVIEAMKSGDAVDFLRWLIRTLADGGFYNVHGALCRQCPELGLKDDADWSQVIEKLEGPALRGVLGEMMLVDPYSGKVSDYSLKETAALYSVDAKQIEKVVREEAKQAFRMPKHMEQFVVDAEFLAKVQDTYSADRIADKGTLRDVFEFRGRLWVCTGGGGNPQAMMAVPAAEFEGTAVDYATSNVNPEDGHHGIKASCGGRAYVLSKPKIEFTTAAPSAEKEKGKANKTKKEGKKVKKRASREGAKEAKGGKS
jgi:ParB/RepB/Spo0J family partition protein